MPASEITPDSNIVLDLGADSLDLLELITKLETVFRIDLPLQEEEKEEGQYPGKLGTFKRSGGFYLGESPRLKSAPGEITFGPRDVFCLSGRFV